MAVSIDELELFLTTFVFHSNCFEIRSQIGQSSSFPHIPNYLPRTSKEWMIHYFNLNRQNLLLHQNPSETLQWILESSSQLNSKNLVHYLTESEERLEILSSLTQKIVERNQTNYIECFRDFLLTTGGIVLISGRGGDGVVAEEEKNSKLTKLLEVFSSVLLSSSSSSRSHSHNSSGNSNQFETLYELSQCILTLNNAILTGQESYALPLFFETIKKITSEKLQMFSPRELSSLYNTLRSNGPYTTPSPPQSNQELLASPIFSASCSVLYSQKNTSHSLRSLASSTTSTRNDSIFQKREIYLTPTALYLDPLHSDSSSPPFMECIPLDSIQFVRSDKENSTCELHPTDRTNSLPVVEYRYLLNSNSLLTDPSPQLFLSFYQNIQLKFSPLANSEACLQQLDDCLWKLRSASFS
jgi:hypothetical protein